MALRRRAQAGPGSPLFPGFSEVGEIGVGSLATVYRAREIGTNRLVALKLLNVRDASARAIESFERESIALGALSSHPNIVTLYRQFRTEDGRPVLVLELCGGAISEQMRNGEGMPVQQAVSIAIKVAGALETAHRVQILHRDVKPQNILITEFGEPALADFGVAMLQSSTQTTAGLFDFTTLHAAPELLEGGATSAATDVYELASTLYQLIAGQSAFRAYEGESPASVILRILRDPVQPVVTAGVPVRLSDLLVRAMSKDKDHRPPTAAEFAGELSQIEAAEGWPRTQFLIRDAHGQPGLAPSVTRLPEAGAGSAPVWPAQSADSARLAPQLAPPTGAPIWAPQPQFPPPQPQFPPPQPQVPAAAAAQYPPAQQPYSPPQQYPSQPPYAAAPAYPPVPPPSRPYVASTNVDQVLPSVRPAAAPAPVTDAFGPPTIYLHKQVDVRPPAEQYPKPPTGLPAQQSPASDATPAAPSTDLSPSLDASPQAEPATSRAPVTAIGNVDFADIDFADLDLPLAPGGQAGLAAIQSTEAARIQAERVEAARVEAERVEAERVEAERAEAERVEAARVEAERAEAVRVEAARVEAERAEAVRAEAVRVEAARVEAERAEAVRVEAARVEAERVEAERVEAERVEAERVEAERRAADELRAQAAVRAWEQPPAGIPLTAPVELPEPVAPALPRAQFVEPVVQPTARVEPLPRSQPMVTPLPSGPTPVAEPSRSNVEQTPEAPQTPQASQAPQATQWGSEPLPTGPSMPPALSWNLPAPELAADDPRVPAWQTSPSAYGTSPGAGELSLDPMSLRPRLAIRSWTAAAPGLALFIGIVAQLWALLVAAGVVVIVVEFGHTSHNYPVIVVSAVGILLVSWLAVALSRSSAVIDDRQVRSRAGLTRSGTPWEQVVGIEVRSDDDESGLIVLQTPHGDVELPATRRSAGELQHVEAQFEAYRARARLRLASR